MTKGNKPIDLPMLVFCTLFNTAIPAPHQPRPILPVRAGVYPPALCPWTLAEGGRNTVDQVQRIIDTNVHSHAKMPGILINGETKQPPTEAGGFE